MKYYELDNQISTIFELYDYCLKERIKLFGTKKFHEALEDLTYVFDCLNEIWDDAISNRKFEISNRCLTISETMHKMRQRNPLPFSFR